MKLRPTRWQSVLCVVGVLLVGLLRGDAARAQGAATPPSPPLQPGAVVRRIVMRDAMMAELFRAKLEQMKASGLFRDSIPGIDPKKPVQIDISFLTSGNYLLMIGSAAWVDANLESVRLMGYLFERPRAHLQLSLRVVQLTGPANNAVIQLTDTVRALVDTQKDEIVRTFAELEAYLLERLERRQGEDRKVFTAAQQLMPALGSGLRPSTVPEILVLLMLDRASPALSVPAAGAADAAGGAAGEKPAADMNEEEATRALLDLPRRLQQAAQDPSTDEARLLESLKPELAAWKRAVTAARDWCLHYADQLDKAKDNGAVSVLSGALEQPQSPLPGWLSRRLRRSMELTGRLYPNLLRRYTEDSLREMSRRFAQALEREAKLEQALAQPEDPARPAKTDPKKPDAKAVPVPAASPFRLSQNLLALKSLAEELVPAPLALFEAVAAAADNAAPTAAQLVDMMGQYARERRVLEARLTADQPMGKDQINFARLQTLEVSLNLWLRRVSEAMARALDTQFYRRYANELRILANKELGKGSSRDLLSRTTLDDVPDVTRDVLLADSGVNLFVSNSVSLQFSPETSNTVSAQVQAALPSKTPLLERIQQAQTAMNAMNALTKQFGIDGESIVKAILSGGQAVPVQAGVTLTANPTIGVDASTITLTLSANQTLQPGSDRVADRVTNHSINNATITALSYEPMVLSTLASNVSYYERTGGIPILRRTPILKELFKDLPLGPLQEKKRERGLYQSSVLILEPVVIPTIEDMVRFHQGWQESGVGPGVKVLGVKE